MHSVEKITLPSAAFGTERQLQVHRFGTPGQGRKAYVQAALHADETPAMLVAQHLIQALAAADAAGAILGEVVVVPVANPIGLSQRMLNLHVGRGDLGGGGNFNRGFPDLHATTRSRLDGRLGSDAAENDRLIRAALTEAAAASAGASELEALKRRLLALAADAHYVLDLHCHFEGVTYVYCNDDRPANLELAAQIGSRATLVGAEGGGMSFDEACDRTWTLLARAFPERVAHGCLAATIEYRGQADVSDELAAEDAANLMAFLQRQGVVAGSPAPCPAPLCRPSPVDGVDHVRSPVPGIIVHKVELGETVREGQVVAEIVAPSEDAAAHRTLLRARTSGVAFGRLFSRLARPGVAFLSIAGDAPEKVADGYGDPYP